MARRVSTYVEVAGPLFDHDVARKLNGAVYTGMAEIADEGDDIMAAQIAAGGLVDTGRLLRSVDIMTKRSSLDVVGYYSITPTDTWQGSVAVTKIGETTKLHKRSGKMRAANVYNVSSSTNVSRPTKTWVSRGVRSGQKLRPGYDFYARTATALRRMDPNKVVLPYIVAALD